MNQALRILLFCGIMLSALFTWVACMVCGFALAFTDYYFMYNVTPFIGLIGVITLIKSAMFVLKYSQPLDYLTEKFNRFRKYVV